MKGKILYFIIGILTTMVILLFVNAWSPKNGSAGLGSICCSSDGKLVYVSDFNGVQKSEDAGKTWNFVITK